MASRNSATRVVLAAFAGNLAIAVTKFVAAAVTGSSAMLSEGIHSLVDTVNELLLLYGLKRAAKPPDAERPFGYGRELFNIVAALSVEFEDGLSTGEIETCVNRVESAIRCKHPDIVVFYVKPQTPESWVQRTNAAVRASR